MSEFTMNVLQKTLNDSKGAWDKLGQALADSMHDESQMPGKTRLMAEYQKKNPNAPVIAALGYAASETERLRVANYVRRKVQHQIKEVAEKIGANDPLIDVLKASVRYLVDGTMLQYAVGNLRSIELLDRIVETMVTNVIDATAFSAVSFRESTRPVTMSSTLRHHRHLRSTVGARLVREAWKL